MDPDGYSELTRPSKVMEKVKTSNRRVKRVETGNLISKVIVEEQYKKTTTDDKMDNETEKAEPYKPISKGKYMIEANPQEFAEAIYFGVTVVVKNSMGLYINLDDAGNVSASNVPTKFIVIDTDHISCRTHVVYGHRIALVSPKEKLLGTRIKMNRNEPQNLFRLGEVEYFGQSVGFPARWKCINPKDVYGTLNAGNHPVPILPGDKFLLENDWHFICQGTNNAGIYLDSIKNENLESGDIDGRFWWSMTPVSESESQNIVVQENLCARARAQLINCENRHLVGQGRPFAQEIRHQMEKYGLQKSQGFYATDPTSCAENSNDAIQQHFDAKLKKNKKVLSYSNKKLKPIPKKRKSVAVVEAPTISVLQQAKLLALADELEATIPIDTWEEIRYQYSCVNELEGFRAQMKAVRKIQNIYRAWRNDRWSRSLRTQDTSMLEEILKNPTRSSADPSADDGAANTGRSEFSTNQQRSLAVLSPVSAELRERFDDTQDPHISCTSELESHYRILQQSNREQFKKIPQYIEARIEREKQMKQDSRRHK